MKCMASISHQLYRFEWEVLPERRDDLTHGISLWLAGSARRGTSACWMRGKRVGNSGIGVAINDLCFRSPLAFELYEPLISYADIPKVILAQSLCTRLPNCVPVQQVIGPQGLILTPPSRKDMGDGLTPLEKKKASNDSASSSLNMFGEKQLQEPSWVQVLPGHLKETIGLWDGDEPAHRLEIESVPCVHVVFRLCLSHLYTRSGCFLYCPLYARVETEV